MANYLTFGSPRDRIFKNARLTKSGCLLWSGDVDKDGYGRITIEYRQHRAHRLSYELHHGPIPDGYSVCHRCDTPGCVNPEHLFAGTNADNMADRDAKGRAAPQDGENNGASKLTKADIMAIRAASGSQTAIGKQFGVSQSAVSFIKLGKRWAHV